MLLIRFRRFSLAPLFLCLLAMILSARAATPFAGFYNGVVYITISGNVSFPEHSAGAVGLTIREDGTVASSSDLAGTVDAGGAITWAQPNSLHLATGAVADGVVSATGSETTDGTTTTFRISASSIAPGFAGASPLAGRIEQVNPAGNVSGLSRVRFANGKYMAAGAHGTVAFSEDGLNWERIGLATSLALYDIAFGNGIYVAAGEAGLVFTSTNRLDWTARSTGVTGFTSVAFGNGIFMRSTAFGGYQVSADGITWQTAAVTAPAAGGYAGLDFAGDKFVLYNGNVVLTANGSASAGTGAPGVGTIVPGQASGARVAFGNGVYVIGGQSGVAFSADGNAWTKGTGPTLRTDAIGFGNGLFAIMDSAKNIWISADGAAWRQTAVFQTGISSIAYGNGRFVGVGQALMTSVNGETWLQPGTDGARIDLAGIYFELDRGIPKLLAISRSHAAADPAYGPAQAAPVQAFFRPKSTSIGYFWVGDAGYIYYYAGNPAFVTNAVGLAPVLTPNTLRAIAPIQDMAVAIGGDNGTIILATRTNGLKGPAFEVVASPTTANLYSGAASVLVGAGGTILRSVTGKTWTQVNSGTTETLRHVFYYSPDEGYNGNYYIAVGDNGTILTSKDGIAWTKRNSGTNARLIGSGMTSLTNPKTFLAMGEDGAVLQSANGTNWAFHTQAPEAHRLTYFQNWGMRVFGAGENGEILQEALITPAPESKIIFMQTYDPIRSFTGFALGNGVWVAVGDRVTGVSTDAHHWTYQGQGQGFVGVVYGEGKFVAATADGAVGISSDGLNWRMIQISNANAQFSGIAYGGGRFAIVGAKIFVSDDAETWTDKSIALSAGLNAVTAGDGKFVAVGDNGVNATSIDNGTTWTAPGTGAQIQESVVYGNGRFASVGLDGRFAYSANGTSWSGSRLNGPTSAEGRPGFRRIAFTGSEFYAATSGGTLYSSTNGIDWRFIQGGWNVDVFAMAYGNGQLLLGGGHEIHVVTMPNTGGPTITSQPTDLTTAQSSTAHFSADFSGDALQFTWSKDGQPLVDGGRISGAATATLTIAGALPEDEGAYSLVAYNAQGSRVTREATLTLGAVVAGFEVWAALNLPEGQRGILDDPDHDGLSNIAEYAFGLNPTAADGALPRGVAKAITGQSYAAVEFTRDTTTAGVTIRVDASASLDFATTVATTETTESLGNGIERVTVRVTQATGPNTTLFFRVSIQKN